MSFSVSSGRRDAQPYLKINRKYRFYTVRHLVALEKPIDSSQIGLPRQPPRQI